MLLVSGFEFCQNNTIQVAHGTFNSKHILFFEVDRFMADLSIRLFKGTHSLAVVLNMAQTV